MSRLRLSSGTSVRALAVVASCAICVGLIGASRGSITKLTLNPDAQVVDLFDGMESGQFNVRLVAQSPHEGRIFVTNLSDKPLTVAIPKGLVGVQVLGQFGQLPINGQIGNQFGLGQGINQQNGQNGQNGLAQSVGGNATPLGNNNGFPGGNNGAPGGVNPLGFFSIPPEKTVQVGFRSVCLNYGRREPHAGMKYQLVRSSAVTSDPVLQQLLEDDSPRTNREVQQAAAWHLANGLTWDQIVQLKDEKIPGSPRPMFTGAQVQAAREAVTSAKKNAADRPKAAEPRSVAAK